jgi:hypothetical protein
VQKLQQHQPARYEPANNEGRIMSQRIEPSAPDSATYDLPTTVELRTHLNNKLTLLNLGTSQDSNEHSKQQLCGFE